MGRPLEPSGSGDLKVDYQALSEFAWELNDLRGRWDGTQKMSDPTSGFAGEADLTEAVDDFTREWAAAGTAIDSFIAMLATMCQNAVAAFTDTDQALAKSLTTSQPGAHFKASL